MNDFSTLITRDQFIREFVKKQISEIFEQALISEEIATKIIADVITNPEHFFKLHSLIDFEKLNISFYDELCNIASQLILDKQLEIIDYTRIKRYNELILKLLSTRKQIFKEILANNSLQSDSKKKEQNQKVSNIEKLANKTMQGDVKID